MITRLGNHGDVYCVLDDIRHGDNIGKSWRSDHSEYSELSLLQRNGAFSFAVLSIWSKDKETVSKGRIAEMLARSIQCYDWPTW